MGVPSDLGRDTNEWDNFTGPQRQQLCEDTLPLAALPCAQKWEIPLKQAVWEEESGSYKSGQALLMSHLGIPGSNLNSLRETGDPTLAL